MRFRAITLAALALAGTFALTAAANATTVNVGGGSGPWDPTNINNFDYGIHDNFAPATIGVTAGANISIQYISGMTGEFGDTPGVDALGYVGNFFGTGLGESQTGSSGTFFPSYTISGPIGSPIYLGALIGVFLNSSGDVIGTPFAPGDSLFTTIAPVGATTLAFGINDDIFADNIGSLSVAVTSSATGVPEPLTLSLFGVGFAGMAALRRRKIKSA